MADKFCLDHELPCWPYPLEYGKESVVETDVLVIGGGLAGGMAGIAAACRGVRVAVADKAPVIHSGDAGAGIDHWNKCLSNPKSPMTPEDYMAAADQIPGMGHCTYISMKGTWEALLELEKLGLPIRDESGEFSGTELLDDDTGLLKGYDYTHLVHVKLRGGNALKPTICKGLKAAGVELYERVMMTCLLTNGGADERSVVGAVGFSLTTGELFIFHAKSVIISSGQPTGMWTFNTELFGNGWRNDPNNVGEGFAMAWKAGAEMFGMSRAGTGKGGHPFGWPRFGVGICDNSWFPCSIVDAKGKEVPWEDLDGNPVETVEGRNRPNENQVYIASSRDMLKGTRKPLLVQDLGERIKNGEFELPFYADLSGMPEKERRSIWGLMIGNEGKTRYAVYDYYAKAGFNPETDMLQAPIMAPDSYSGAFMDWFQGEPDVVKPWRPDGAGGQIAVDWNLMSNIKGLFAAGSSAGQSGASFACSSGSYAGNRAAEYAKKAEFGVINRAQLEQEKERIYAPVKRKDDPEAYISWKELWSGIARVMQCDCGEYRSIGVYRHALMWLDSIRQQELGQTYARTPHELARVLECETRLTCCEATVQAFIAEAELKAQGGGRDKVILNRLADGVFQTVMKENRFWLQAPYAGTYLENYNICRAAEREV